MADYLGRSFSLAFGAGLALGAAADRVLRFVSHRAGEPDVLSALHTVRSKVILKKLAQKIPIVVLWEGLKRL